MHRMIWIYIHTCCIYPRAPSFQSLKVYILWFEAASSWPISVCNFQPWSSFFQWIFVSNLICGISDQRGWFRWRAKIRQPLSLANHNDTPGEDSRFQIHDDLLFSVNSQTNEPDLIFHTLHLLLILRLFLVIFNLTFAGDKRDLALTLRHISVYLR